MMSLWIMIAALAGLTAQADMKTVSYVDPARYVEGPWYQIARKPVFFETGCVCSRQSLTITGPGTIRVYNSCNNQTPNGALREIRGTATVVNTTTNAELSVDFGLPNKGKYWVIALDSEYRYAVVSEPAQSVLYILSKTPELAPELYDRAVREASEQADTSTLQKTLQTGCSYPAEAVTPALNSVAAPSDPAHPGSKTYAYGLEKQKLKCAGRDVDVFIPKSTNSTESFPVVVYGHGQALGLEHYAGTLDHLAKKGIATVFPMYDNGFFDQDWTRMGRDFVNLTDCAIKQTGGRLNRDQVVFSGHSKGAYVASIAAGLAVRENLPVRPGAAVLFATAGFDSSSAAHIAPSTALTVVFGDQDTVVERNFSESIFSAAASARKQFILVKSYPASTGKALPADHYWPQTKGSFFGGGPESALHYYGSWKWLTAAALDLKAGGKATDAYLYGDLAADKGAPGLQDEIRRNW